MYVPSNTGKGCQTGTDVLPFLNLTAKNADRITRAGTLPGAQQFGWQLAALGEGQPIFEG